MYFLNVCCGDRCLLSPVVILWPGLGSPPASKASAFLTYWGLTEQSQPQLILHHRSDPCLQLGVWCQFLVACNDLWPVNDLYWPFVLGMHLIHLLVGEDRLRPMPLEEHPQEMIKCPSSKLG